MTAFIQVSPDLLPGLALLALSILVVTTVLVLRWVLPRRKRDRLKELD